MTDKTHAQQEPAISQGSWRIWPWLAGGVILAASMGLCVWAKVTHNASAGALVLPSVGMGALYLALVVLRPIRASRLIPATMIVVAILMRLPWFFVPTSGGEDYCRYLWDGAVTANGINPYVRSPQQVAGGQTGDPVLERLAQSGRITLEGINHPELRTIYPPTAQGAFALAYWITPFDLTGWRLVLLAFDVMVTLAVLGLLRATGLPLVLGYVYLWNPLLVMETYGGCHVDILAAAMVVMFAWALATKRPTIATIVLALAIGVKLWPVLLLPFLLRSLWGKWRRLAVSAGILAALVVIMAIPFARAAGAGSDSGLTTYALTWAGRSGAYLVFDMLGRWLRSYLSLGTNGHHIGRALMMMVLLPAVLWLGLRRPCDSITLCRRIGLVILLMLLLSPALWPWYYVTVIPLAAVTLPRPSLLLWTALLPLCYLKGAGLPAVQVIGLVHVSVWLVLAVEWTWRHLAGRLGGEAAHA